MIRVNTITITEFRGIRNLTMNFGGKNYAVCGPNGTGKSGVVDALEFVLTGNISRLSGEGMGDVSVKSHAPHVDCRNKPGDARVSATVSIPPLQKSYLIERNAKTPSAIQITPDELAARKLFEAIAKHPEVVLSRRELIRYVLATPGKRAEEVQALLHLDQVEDIRSLLQKIANSLDRQVPTLSANVSQARENLRRALDVGDLTPETILNAANARRAIIGLPALTGLTEKTTLKDGMATPGAAKPQRITKAQAVADLKALQESVAEIGSTPTALVVAEVSKATAALSGDAAVTAGVAKENFLRLALQQVESGSCPVCDTPWDFEELRALVHKKLERLESATAKRKAVEKKIPPLTGILTRLNGGLEAVIRDASLLATPLSMPNATAYNERNADAIRTLSTFVPIADTLTTLKAITSVPAGFATELKSFETAVASMPEPSKADAARDWLILGQEKLQASFDARRAEKAAKAKAELAKKVAKAYATVSDAVLTGIYDAVQKQFAELYGFVNREDESRFEAKLVPSMGKLGFDVDFYGRGFFPPGAYHSEGHQDSMGLCLYLALMRHLHGANFTFAVLDDVLMSVDSGHRREVCAMLKKQFPDTQFVMTTHDPIWLRHMRTESLITSKSGLQFKNWSVDRGPTLWDDRDVWTEIDQELKGNNVRAAAGLLRNYLEYISGELCDYLRAPVGFRGDARYQLGELLPSAIGRLRKLYSSAKESANSWGQKDTLKQISVAADTFDVLVATSNSEQWQMNEAIHYNSWENLKKADFAPVAKSFEALIRGFCCPGCGEFLRVSPDRERPESLRCDCGKTNLNLLKKG